MTRLSRQGKDVLDALAQPANGRLEIWRLVKRLQSLHGSVASTRASLSRTLRRLWQAGYVELENDWRVTLTEQQAEADARLAQLEADPEGEYRRQADAIAAGKPGFFPFTSATEYLEHRRWSIRRWDKRNNRHTAAVLTPAGRERVSITTTYGNG
jgi:DNA-binding MarR family transcriptional regulator